MIYRELWIVHLVIHMAYVVWVKSSRHSEN
jgi:hypothetical protein